MISKISPKIYSCLLAIMLSVVTLSLVSCASNSDPYAAYKKKSAAVIYAQAEKNLAKGYYKEASEDLDALDGLYPFGAYAQQGQLESIYAYYKNDEPALAMAQAQRYIRLYPRAEDVDYAYYMQGLTGFEMGGGWLQKKLGLDRSARDISNYQDAFISFSMLVNRFPRSIYATDSLTRMRFIRNVIAHHEYEVAEFYWKREAYVAASNRASFVVQHFQGAPVVVPALAMQVRAARKLDLSRQAAQSLALLRYNYPGSKSYRRLAHS